MSVFSACEYLKLYEIVASVLDDIELDLVYVWFSYDNDLVFEFRDIIKQNKRVTHSRSLPYALPITLLNAMDWYTQTQYMVAEDVKELITSMLRKRNRQASFKVLPYRYLAIQTYEGLRNCLMDQRDDLVAALASHSTPIIFAFEPSDTGSNLSFLGEFEDGNCVEIFNLNILKHQMSCSPHEYLEVEDIRHPLTSFGWALTDICHEFGLELQFVSKLIQNI